VLFEAGVGVDGYRRVGNGLPPGARQDVVKARLSNLLASLGEFSADRSSAPAEWRPALRRFLDENCPAEVVVMHGRRLAHRPLTIEHLLVAPRGVVVVGPSFGQVLSEGVGSPGPLSHPGPLRHPGPLSHPGPPASGPAGAGLATKTWPGPSRPRARRPVLVRETLRRCYALRSWLEASCWESVPVLAAVCSCPVNPQESHPGLMLDGLWLGTADQLPDWLVSEPAITGADRAQLATFLAAALPVG
jgi:hypothetical protein